MNVQAVDLGYKLVELIQFLLMLAPIVPGAPIFDEFLHVLDGNAVLPAGAVDLVRPARAGQAILQVAEHRVFDRNFERHDSSVFGLILCRCSRRSTSKDEGCKKFWTHGKTSERRGTRTVQRRREYRFLPLFEPSTITLSVTRFRSANRTVRWQVLGFHRRGLPQSIAVPA